MPFLAVALVSSILLSLAAHKFMCVVVGWLLFSALVDGMPAPACDSSLAYRWLHASLNLLAGNLFRVLCALAPKFAALCSGTKPEPPQ